MAVTAVLQRNTSHRLVYLVTQDGAGGTTLTIANATLLTDIGAAGRPLSDALRELVITNQAQARALFGRGTPPGRWECRLKLQSTDGAGATPWGVDPNKDAGGNYCRIDIVGPAAAANALLEIVLLHSVVQ